ncbi:MAG: hypothetical protein HGA36_00800 [Candidatus Moranbacteria bacterium]|nr:hypothetical protein [Candidatus Moranbacteria bacterium]
MEKQQYLDILRKAFFLTWENKFLWFFGFLIMLGSVSSSWDLNDKGSVGENETVQMLTTFAQNHVGLVATLGTTFFFIAIALFLLRIVATVAIIKSANDINLYKQMSVVAILKEARQYLWKLLALEMLIGITLLITFLLLATPVIYLFTLKAKTLAFLALFLALAITIPLLILSFYLNKYASFYIVLVNGKIRMALEAAYEIFAKNIKMSLVMGLVMIVTCLIMLIAVLFLGLMLAIVCLPIGFGAYLLFAKTGIVVLGIVVAVIFAATCTVVFSWYAAFLQTVWLMFFQQIAMMKNNEKKIQEEIEIEGEIPNPEIV